MKINLSTVIGLTVLAFVLKLSPLGAVSLMLAIILAVLTSGGFRLDDWWEDCKKDWDAIVHWHP